MKKIFFGLLLTVMAGYSCNKSHDNSTSTWDFTKQKVYVYNYSKKQDTKNKIKIDNPWEQKYMTRSGKFYIQSTNKQLANLLYPNATTFLKLVDEKTQTNDTMSFLSIGFAKYNLSARGSFLDSDSLILFPHFSKKLIKGNKDTLPAFFKFNAPVVKLLAKGFYILEYSSDTVFAKRNCAVLQGKFMISDLILPHEFAGEIKISRTGYATYYFDKESICYAGANIKFTDDIYITHKATNKEESDFYLIINNSVHYNISLDEIKKNVSLNVNPAKF